MFRCSSCGESSFNSEEKTEKPVMVVTSVRQVEHKEHWNKKQKKMMAGGIGTQIASEAKMHARCADAFRAVTGKIKPPESTFSHDFLSPEDIAKMDFPDTSVKS